MQALDVDHLGALSEDLDLDLYIAARPGAWVGPGSPLLLGSRRLTTDERRRLREPFVVGTERSLEADPRFGFVVLSEIACRALSPAVNDPGTAIDVATTSARLLCEWGSAAPPCRTGLGPVRPGRPAIALLVLCAVGLLCLSWKSTTWWG